MPPPFACHSWSSPECRTAVQTYGRNTKAAPRTGSMVRPWGGGHAPRGRRSTRLLLRRAGLHDLVEGRLVVVIARPDIQIVLDREAVARVRRHMAGEDRRHAIAIGPGRLVDAAGHERRAQ